MKSSIINLNYIIQNLKISIMRPINAAFNINVYIYANIINIFNREYFTSIYLNRKKQDQHIVIW